MMDEPRDLFEHGDEYAFGMLLKHNDGSLVDGCFLLVEIEDLYQAFKQRLQSEEVQGDPR